MDALWPPLGGPDLPPAVQPLVEAASADAVASLGALAGWAGLDLPPSDPAVQRAVAYLLKRWGADPNSEPGAGGEGGGGRPPPSQDQPRPASGGTEPEEGEARETPPDARAALRAAFRGNPKAVLRGIAAAAGAGRPAEAAAAEAATRGVLLVADPDWVTAGDAATDAGVGAAVAAAAAAAARLGPGAAPDSPPCLAATVLGPDGALRAWLDGEARGGEGDRRDGPGPGRAGARLLRQVVAALPPLEQAVLQAAAAPAAAAAAAAAARAAPGAPGTTPTAPAAPCLIGGPTLRLAPLPPAATPADLAAACAKYAPVRGVVRLVDGGTAAEVDFWDVGGAAVAFQGLARACPPPWWGRAGGRGDPPAVDVRFCAAAPEETAEAAAPAPSAFVWVPGVGTAAALAGALAVLAAAGVLPPADADTRRVGGRDPCIVFRFGDIRTGRAAADALAAAASAAAAAASAAAGSTGGSAPHSTAQPWSAGPASQLQLPPADEDGAGGALPALPPGTWAGLLAKAGLPVCDGLECLDGPDPAAAAAGSAAGCEPVAWPPALDVSLRVDVAFVLQAVLEAGPADRIAVRRLALAPDTPRAARAAFIEFLNALSGRRRAGVVELPATGSGVYDNSGHGSAPPRRLYLVPPSNSVAARLGVEWAPTESLFVVVAPPPSGGV